MATAAKPRPIRPVGTNFEPKRIRKAKRKMLVRGALGNIVADARMGAEDRAEFYRNLRMIKLRRRHLAKEMATLAGMVQGLVGSVQNVGNRNPEFNARSLEEARDQVKAAYTSVSVAADEFQLFSRVRVYYVKG
ncbi:hypothetical protein [Streptosporangium sp. NPDC051022]|uniref:hypothetical protein n=1 Tax=Streptosporangium sp. NPDC051022 TaxID=3155752 RepID=UPI003428E7D4